MTSPDVIDVPVITDRANGGAVVTRAYALQAAVDELAALRLGSKAIEAAAQRGAAWASIAALVDDSGRPVAP